MVKLKEKDTQRTILDWLTVKKIFHYRNNSGGAMVQGHSGKGQFIRFGALGSPDIVCVVKGQYIGIEVKGTGGKQSDNQKQFQADLEKAGGKYILAYSLEDVIEKLSTL